MNAEQGRFQSLYLGLRLKPQLYELPRLIWREPRHGRHGALIDRNFAGHSQAL